MVKIWLVSSCGKFMQYLETFLLIAWSRQSFVSSCDGFLLSFSDGYTKWNTAATENILLFMVCLSIGFLVQKYAACPKSGFGKHRFQKWAFSLHLAWCVIESKSLKRFLLYLMAFRTCISTSKPELFLYLMGVFLYYFMKSSVVYTKL